VRPLNTYIDRPHKRMKSPDHSEQRLTATKRGELDRSLAAPEAAIARKDMAAAKAAHDAFHGLLLASARNPLLVAMFNQAQVARLSNISPEHRSFYDPRHLAHHPALLRALRKRDGRSAAARVRRALQSLGLMLEFVSSTRKKSARQVSSRPSPASPLRGSAPSPRKRGYGGSERSEGPGEGLRRL